MAEVILIVARLIDIALSIYSFVIIARAFLPLVGADPYNPVVQFIHRITEPLLAPLRRWTIYGTYDFAPLAALIGLMIVRQIVYRFFLSLLPVLP